MATLLSTTTAAATRGPFPPPQRPLPSLPFHQLSYTRNGESHRGLASLSPRTRRRVCNPIKYVEGDERGLTRSIRAPTLLAHAAILHTAAAAAVEDAILQPDWDLNDDDAELEQLLFSYAECYFLPLCHMTKPAHFKTWPHHLTLVLGASYLYV